MTDAGWILGIQAFASAALCGLIWFVQLVHYPLFARVTGDGDREYASEHQRRTPVVVIPLMLAEGVTAAMVAAAPPPAVPRTVAWVGLALVLAVWASTWGVQVPLHARLRREGHVREVVDSLVRSNGLRTALWTARGLLAVWMLRAAA